MLLIYLDSVKKTSGTLKSLMALDWLLAANREAPFHLVVDRRIICRFDDEISPAAANDVRRAAVLTK